MAKPKGLLSSSPMRLGLGLLAGYLLATPGWMVGGAWFVGLAIVALAGVIYSYLQWPAGKLFALGAFVMSLVGAALYAVAYAGR